jgi:hypothetical protein
MSASLSVAVAVSFVWPGMVLAISFVEAPLKFRAPGVTLRIGLGIGRLVFRALNGIEVVLAVTLGVALLLDAPPLRVGVGAVVALGVTLVQLGLVRPVLSRRSDRVLAGEDAARSRAHYWYVGLEVVKVIALAVTGAFMLAL